MQKHFMKVAAVLSLSFLVFFFGCSNVLSNSENDSVEYGSISISSSRALDVSTLTSATVTVSGWGMTDISKSSVSIQNGAGSFQIDNIPVGKNRIVTVKNTLNGKDVSTESFRVTVTITSSEIGTGKGGFDFK